MNKKELLLEVEDILLTIPPVDDLQCRSADGLSWVGRAAAAISRWNVALSVAASSAVSEYTGEFFNITRGVDRLKALLYQARADLRMEVGPLSVVVQQGQVFDYFDQLRKVIGLAQSELFFVDPYLDAEFVSRYLPHLAKGVTVRLLGGSMKMATLLPAVDSFKQQSGIMIQVRSSGNIHDRYLFVDRTACYLSGASFKDGAKHAPSVLTQITDAFQTMLSTYETLWTDAKVEK